MKPRPDGPAIAATIKRALAAAGLLPPSAPVPQYGAAANDAVVEDSPARRGEFVTRVHAGPAGSRSYKLYVPKNFAQHQPLVVMLHGCTQTPDDFAAGTRMNVLADKHGFLVAYPAQAARANGSRCWNWFMANEQQRDGPEASIIAGTALEIQRTYRVDPQRIFVAGLSSGAAMAVILGATYPELFEAIGVHSGLPHGAAHDMPSAFVAMQRGGSLSVPAHHARRPARTILFHGDDDNTVNVRNATLIAEQLLPQFRTSGHALKPVMRPHTANGRAATVTRYLDSNDRAVIEQWTVHGAAHAWSGGSPAGSYTDPAGPDASAEMVRFFLSRGLSVSR